MKLNQTHIEVLTAARELIANQSHEYICLAISTVLTDRHERDFSFEFNLAGHEARMGILEALGGSNSFFGWYLRQECYPNTCNIQIFSICRLGRLAWLDRMIDMREIR